MTSVGDEISFSLWGWSLVTVHQVTLKLTWSRMLNAFLVKACSIKSIFEILSDLRDGTDGVIFDQA